MPDASSPRDAEFSAQFHADVAVERIADVYAEALLGAADAAGRTESLLQEFDSLVADVLDRFRPFEQVLNSGLISHEEKIAVLDRTLASRASSLLLDFLKVLSRHGRLDCLRAVHRRFHAAYDRARGRVPVRVTTAAAISDQLVAQIAQRLGTAVAGQPVLEHRVDPQLIGGAVVRVGDTVYDGSIATQLENVRQQMIDRSAHEIQSRRDRFRNSAGN